MFALVLAVLLTQAAPEYNEVEPHLCQPEDAACQGPIELNPLDRAIIFAIKEEMRRQELLRKRNENLPVCPIEPGYWYNLDCA